MYVFLKILLYPMFWKMSVAERETWHHIQTIQFIYQESGLGKITNTHPPGGTAVQRFPPYRCNLSVQDWAIPRSSQYLVDEPVGGKQYGPKNGTIHS